MTLRWKLLITNLAAALFAIAVLGGYTEHAVRGYYLRELEESLDKSAIVVSNQVGREIASGDTRAADSLAKTLYRQTGYRFTFIDRRGKVLGDGEYNPAKMVNHAGRPEVVDALRTGRGVRLRHSNTIGADMLYVAIPAPIEGVVRIAVLLTSVDASVGRIRIAFAGVILLTILLSLLFSAKLADRITGPIRELRTKAVRIAGGDLDQKISSHSQDEIGDLARAFGRMASQIKAMLTEATEEHNKIRAIFSGMTDGVLVVEPSGRVSLINEAARAELGLDEGEAGAGSIIEVTHNHEIDAAVSEAASNREPREAEIRLALPEDRVLTLLASPVTDEKGLLISTIVLLHDITEIRKLERIRRDFVASASHELRTPITTIRLMAESLQAGAHEDPKLRDQFLVTILDSTNRLAALVDDLLTLSRLEHPTTLVMPKPVPVLDLVDLILPQFSHRAQQQGLDIRVNVPEEIEVLGDVYLLEHALANLLDNAIKYTPLGHVEIKAEKQGDWVLISVTDTGMGIPSQHLPRIFERFYRVDKARSREMGGTGLGLSIVKHVVEEHGGTVEVESELGKGTTFTMRLPAAGVKC